MPIGTTCDMRIIPRYVHHMHIIPHATTLLYRKDTHTWSKIFVIKFCDNISLFVWYIRMMWYVLGMIYNIYVWQTCTLNIKLITFLADYDGGTNLDMHLIYTTINNFGKVILFYINKFWKTLIKIIVTRINIFTDVNWITFN